MSLYNRDNPEHEAYRDHWRAASERYNAKPKWSVELHNPERTKLTVHALTMDDAHKLAEASLSPFQTVRQDFKYGATIVAVHG